jgi:uncharacterized membrane protein
MVYFGLGMGSLLVLIGLATYYIAPRVGPNPIFGVRNGYAYASREVWDKTNRYGGALLTLVGIGIAIAGVAGQLLNLPSGMGMPLLTIILLVAMLGSTARMLIYSRTLAQGTTLAHELAPVKFRWAYLAPVLVTFALLVAVMLYFYPALPAAQMATHFDINDQPNGWMPRDVFVVSYLGLAALFVILNAVAVIVATREPLIAFGRLGAHWRIDPERGLIFAGFAFALTNIIFIVALLATAWYNIHGTQLFPLSALVWMILPMIAIFMALFFALARREK